ncbi:hypothetical protein NIES267_73640 (plasmid) [Calothrix parasitica NIES-267]|uniref:Uncharacterized protein n=1 Tax=Calothrix parasitica NIES-267 TaxID=1973488 RepID=A0A1Z4M2Y5_9CYAN|nr:hypothetical protein NIES267_73640 [Calothrix parasitica NIES-267]
MSNTAVKEKIEATNNRSLNEQEKIKIEIKNTVDKYKDKDIADPLNVDYEEPKPKKNTNYTYFEEGDTRIRILSEGISGYQYWITEKSSEGKEINKPVRVPFEEVMNIDIDIDYRTFYAYFVYNYNLGKIQILNHTKKSISKKIRKCMKRAGYEDPKSYDLIINKEVADKNDPYSTEYEVMPEKVVLDPEIQERWEQSQFNTNALYLLFDNKDPFEMQKQLLETKSKAKS